MQFAKKVTLIPPKSQIGGGNENSIGSGSINHQVENKSDKIKLKIYDKIHRFIKVILKLAQKVGYDDQLRIKLRNGKFLENTNIVDLLTHAMSFGKVLYGENEFVQLLSDSEVDPELIINQNVKLKLIQLNKSSKKPVSEINDEFQMSEKNSGEQDNKSSNKKSIDPETAVIAEKEATENKKQVKQRKRKIIEVNNSDTELEIEPPNKKALNEEEISDEMIDSSQWVV